MSIIIIKDDYIYINTFKECNFHRYILRKKVHIFPWSQKLTDIIFSLLQDAQMGSFCLPCHPLRI